MEDPEHYPPTTRSGGAGGGIRRWMGRRNNSQNGSKQFEVDDTSVASSTADGSVTSGRTMQRNLQQQQRRSTRDHQLLPQQGIGSASAAEDSSSVATDDLSQTYNNETRNNWGLRASSRRSKKQQQLTDADSSDGDAPYTMEDILSIPVSTPSIRKLNNRQQRRQGGGVNEEVSRNSNHSVSSVEASVSRGVEASFLGAGEDETSGQQEGGPSKYGDEASEAQYTNRQDSNGQLQTSASSRNELKNASESDEDEEMDLLVSVFPEEIDNRASDAKKDDPNPRGREILPNEIRRSSPPMRARGGGGGWEDPGPRSWHHNEGLASAVSIEDIDGDGAATSDSITPNPSPRRSGSFGEDISPRRWSTPQQQSSADSSRMRSQTNSSSMQRQMPRPPFFSGRNSPLCVRSDDESESSIVLHRASFHSSRLQCEEFGNGEWRMDATRANSRQGSPRVSFSPEVSRFSSPRQSGGSTAYFPSPPVSRGNDFHYEESYSRTRADGDYSSDDGSQYERYREERPRRRYSSDYDPNIRRYSSDFGPTTRRFSSESGHSTPSQYSGSHEHYCSPRSSHALQREEEDHYNRDNTFSSSYSPPQERRPRPDEFSSSHRNEFSRGHRRGSADSYASGSSGGWGHRSTSAAAVSNNIIVGSNAPAVNTLSERETEALEEKLVRIAMEQSLNQSQTSSSSPQQQRFIPSLSSSPPGPAPHFSAGSRSFETTRGNQVSEYVREDDSHTTDAATATRLAEIEKEQEMLELAIQMSLRDTGSSKGGFASENSLVGPESSGDQIGAYRKNTDDYAARYGRENEPMSETDNRPTIRDQYRSNCEQGMFDDYAVAPSVIRQDPPPRRHPLETHRQLHPRVTAVHSSQPPRLHPLEQQERRSLLLVHHSPPSPPQPHSLQHQSLNGHHG